MATKKQDAQQYNDQSIKALKGADRVRKRPSVIFGSDGLEGCEHSFFEILSNSVDEAKAGHGKEIKVTVFQDRSIEVDDHGRGVPLGWNEAEGRWNWDLIYCELYAGGKYDNNSDGSAYE
ncbi:MAG: DNA topoisomerase, partial [Clostridia bacterium]|nr:DNA topoisomerase [Clostridia bacterium]